MFNLKIFALAVVLGQVLIRANAQDAVQRATDPSSRSEPAGSSMLPTAQ